MTFEQFRTTYDRTVHALPAVLAAWKTLERFERAHYGAEIERVLNLRHEIWHDATRADLWTLAPIDESLRAVAGDLESVLNIRVTDYLLAENNALTTCTTRCVH